MIEHAWSLICTKCVTDPDSKNVTLVEVVEQLNGAPGTVFPVMAPFQTDFVSTWYRSDPTQGARATGRITVHNPDGTDREATQFAIDLTAFYRAHVVIRSAGIGLMATGVYFFVVDFRLDGQQAWQTVARIPFTVALVEGAAQLRGLEPRPAGA
jgi:hypothetical protein